MGRNFENLMRTKNNFFTGLSFVSLLVLCISATHLEAQIGINTTTPDSSAVLDISSTGQGVLFPRMTISERDSIIRPAIGLLIFNTSSNCINLYNGFLWVEICGEIPDDYPLIDGIYVSTNGSNTTGDGSPENPYATISTGRIELNIQNKDTLVIAGGQYNRLTLFKDSSHVYLGGFEDAFWTRDVLLYPTNVESFSGLNSTISLSDSITINGINFSSPTSGSEYSVYGLHIFQSSQIFIENCFIEASAGTNGPDGDPGSDGNPSTSGASSGGAAPGGFGGAIGGGKGGDGGVFGDGGDGLPGNGGAPGGSNGSPGGNGGNGEGGSAGANGMGGVMFGTTGIFYSEADGGDGTSGTDGEGGGGGGGEDVNIGEVGAGGGGGGGGGNAGSNGQGGHGGAGSFGLYSYNSLVTVANCTVQSGDGADGGAGGQGGLGATGSPGGLNNDAGGDGGNGGDGGDGGHGGGGGGGPSYSICAAGTTVFTLINVVLSHGSPGSGGTSIGNTGSVGVAADKNF